MEKRAPYPDRSIVDISKRRVTFLSEMSNIEGSIITFYNVSYFVKFKTGYLGFRKEIKKNILFNISGVMKPGLNAILGPTGCGKSSLLDILSTRKDPKGLSGDILLDGMGLPTQFKCMSGYVVQVGTYFTRGVSGGERKRTSIGLELITNPRVLFLDEPTTGLDASTANAVLLLLKRMSLQGKTIIFSIHQPRYSIFKLFDSLTLLAAGRLLYHGPADNALSYFRSLGFVCEPYNNPADFFLDIINGDSSAVAMSKMTIHSAVLEATEREQETIALTLAVQFSKCSYYKKMLEELDVMSKEQKRQATTIKGVQYSTPFLHQLKWLSRRTFKNLIGNPQNSTAQIAIITVMGIITGAVFSGVKNDATGIQNRVGALFFLATNQVLNSITTVELFITEKRIFIHEYISGYYRVSAYFFSKIIADMLPMRTLPGVILTSLNYFTIGFKPALVSFFIMMFTIILIAYASSSLAMAVATGQNVTSVANLLINICFVFMIVFSGVLVNLTTITPSLLWLEYLSIPRYGLNALQINEFTGLRFCNETPEGVNVTCVSTTAFTVCTGEDYLTMQGIGTTAWDLWQNHVALICMTIIFLTFAYLKLKFLKKYT
ncbi:broad substrate specificity ATP-binding cassette transporter ABCG2-like isoform X4 [Crotalus tigris]|uniref:broad substrate specificity ATP-binding cassette transporter ABCG2-like isoform X4 n=1 Tax=Crotalus tigris TaxID=88082 RepID=UPI00192F72B9|nr:broad substrate specificity ATP-binding cassette transporter ABCG2-like isoform X4 [Crotalus tigris]